MLDVPESTGLLQLPQVYSVGKAGHGQAQKATCKGSFIMILPGLAHLQVRLVYLRNCPSAGLPDRE